jgi:hypothetical protein
VAIGLIGAVSSVILTSHTVACLVVVPVNFSGVALVWNLRFVASITDGGIADFFGHDWLGNGHPLADRIRGRRFDLKPVAIGTGGKRDISPLGVAELSDRLSVPNDEPGCRGRKEYQRHNE